MSAYVLWLHEIDRTKLKLAGGKGAQLGELSRVQGVQVPEGFCVTTEAYRALTHSHQELGGLLDELTPLKAEERERISGVSARIRRALERTPIPGKVAEEIRGTLAKLGGQGAFAVRSSATAEDLPTASSAGQQDTYLNIIGEEAILEHVRRCWASLFTDRAVIYRMQNGCDHRTVQLAVVVQRMVFPQAAGILFTADPVTSNRTVVSIDAGFGLGEAMVSGRVSADSYTVRGGVITGKKISTKKLAIHAVEGGGTQEQEIAPERQSGQVLTDEQILRLARLGRKIEEHFGQPQDIEWCLAEDAFHIVQSRPITTLFPIPEAGDQENHVYVSVGHQQMMTDPIRPLGLSFFLMTTRAPMRKAGGRLFVDVTQRLASPASRHWVIETLGSSEPLIKDALLTVMAREGFIKPVLDEPKGTAPGQGSASAPAVGYQAQPQTDPALVAELIARSQASIEALKHTIRAKSGVELLDFILEDLQELKRILFNPQNMGMIMAALNAYSWINDHMKEWLGEKNAADTLSQSVPNNITSEMGLALMDVADVIRPHPEVIACLQQATDQGFLDELPRFAGGRQARDAIHAFLDRFGMRCSGEIDITRTRWSEKPTALVPMILGNIKNFEPGAGGRRFEQGLQEALKKEQELLERLAQLPEGQHKATETKRMIGLIRNFMGYREYPKYGMIGRYFVYKQALLKEARRLVQARVIHEEEDIYYLSFEELREAVRTNTLDAQVVTQRRDEYKRYERLSPPRVLTSEGENIAGAYRRDDLPAGALVGLAVSSGVVEGRARVILDMEDAGLKDGDILVTPFTDPSWTPLFVSVRGLVTEVGGLMTHGAVIAREYGLPAVVGVQHATQRIKDGQRIRVNGTDGYVEVL